MTLAAKRRLVLFDLDGTLIDSEPGITACLAHAFERIGAELPARAVLRSWIGPPFRQTFPSVLGDDEARIVAAIDHYRDRFEDVGWAELLLRSLGRQLAVSLDIIDAERRLPTAERLARLLAAMATDAADGSTVRATQQQLADLLGVSRVTLGAALRKLVARGVVETRYGSIRWKG